MRGAAAALLCAWLASCGAPEDTNPAPRCEADLRCPEGLMCYRGFCVENPDDLTAVPADDAGIVFSADSAVRTGTGSVSPITIVTSPSSASDDDAAVTFVQDAPGTLVPASPVVDAGAQTSTPPVDASAPTSPPSTPPTTPPVTTPPPVVTTIPCLSECTNVRADDKTCRACFKTNYGQEPDKLCGTPFASGNPVLQAICGSLCAQQSQDKGHGPGGCGGD